MATLQDGLLPPFLGVHPGAAEPRKRWPASRFAAAAGTLQHLLGGTVVVIGGAEARAAGARVAGRVQGRVANLCGRTTLPVLGAMIARLAVLLTNDSGPAHLAYALGTPSVTIFTATDPAEWGPPRGGLHAVVTAAAGPTAVVRAAVNVLRRAARARAASRLPVTLLALAANLVIVWAALRWASLVERLIGEAGAKAVTGVASLLLAATGVTFIRHGVMAVLNEGS